VLDLQPLTDLSNNYTTTKAQLETARAKRNASRTAFERAERLYKDQQNISAAQLQAAEAAYRVDEANVAASQAQLQNFAATAVQIWGPALGRALVERTQALLKLLQRQDVLLQVTLPPGETLDEPPKNAAVQTGSVTQVPIHYVSAAPRTDARIQGVSFYYTAPADKGLLPNMNVTVLLPSNKSGEGKLVPASAVVWSEGKAWGYFRTGLETFARREIPTSSPAPDGGYIVNGIPDNAELVQLGTQMLLSEEYRARIQVGEEGGP
jgi:multidrug efflux pump subunit AcrA (membrane-fusion protein)